MSSSSAKLTARQGAVVAACMVLYFIAPTFGSAATPTIALMPEAYPNVSDATLSYIQTMSTPAAMISGLLVGFLAGRKISFKALGIICLVLYTFFGALPFLWQDLSFEMLLGSRFLFGLGCGALTPIVQTVISGMFVDEKPRSFWIGIGTAIFSTGVTISQTLCGSLGLISWQTSYSFYLIGIIPLIIFAIFFKDSELKGVEEEKEEEVKGSKKLSGTCWFFIVFFCLAVICSQSFFNIMGFAVAAMGANVAVAGTIASVFSLACVIVAVLNAVIWRFLKAFMLPVGLCCYVLMAALVILAVNTSSLPLMYAGAAFCGIAANMVTMVMPMFFSVSVAPVSLAFAISMSIVAQNLGSFLSSPLAQFVEGSIGAGAIPLMSVILVYAAVLAAIAFIVAIRNRNKMKDLEVQAK